MPPKPSIHPGELPAQVRQEALDAASLCFAPKLQPKENFFEHWWNKWFHKSLFTELSPNSCAWLAIEETFQQHGLTPPSVEENRAMQEAAKKRGQTLPPR